MLLLEMSELLSMLLLFATSTTAAAGAASASTIVVEEVMKADISEHDAYTQVAKRGEQLWGGVVVAAALLFIADSNIYSRIDLIALLKQNLWHFLLINLLKIDRGNSTVL